MKVINSQTLGELCEFMLDGEPVFIIRAQDALAANIVYTYCEDSREKGGKNTIRSLAQLQRIENWQKANPHRIKLPD